MNFDYPLLPTNKENRGSAMKRSILFAQMSLAFAIATLFFACSSTSEKTSKDEYFEPVGQIVVQKPESGVASKVITRERYGATSDTSMKDAVIEMLREQNKRLDDVVHQLNSMTKKEVADNSKGTENLAELLSTRDRVSNEVLLEMIRDQNQRLNEVIEQLKILF
jgi:hypothetical protein